VAIADSDRDARLTRSEFVALMSGFGVREAESVRAFDAMDSDGDGLVTSQEFEQATEEFFTSDDPSSVGNALWGAM
jgi:Ca2+-binding EF-hand superfamily protein